jgi:hypothetical protein
MQAQHCSAHSIAQHTNLEPKSPRNHFVFFHNIHRHTWLGAHLPGSHVLGQGVIAVVVAGLADVVLDDDIEAILGQKLRSAAASLHDQKGSCITFQAPQNGGPVTELACRHAGEFEPTVLTS